MDDEQATIDVALVRWLVIAQFPQWRDLPICLVIPSGWDNRTFRLGENMLVRLPKGLLSFGVFTD